MISSTAAVTVARPEVADGVACWRLAAESKVLDVNSRYAYVLWCRDFAATSVVAKSGDVVIGFITGYRRPEQPSTLLVWQVAVDEQVRGLGIGGSMLDVLFDQVPDADRLETTVTPDNVGSAALFSAFARRRDAPIERRELFGADVLGADHDPEILFRIGPINRGMMLT